MTHWKLNSKLILHGITENFNFKDFCLLIKKEHFRAITIKLSRQTSATYQKNFNAAFQDLKLTWSSNKTCPYLHVYCL